MPLITELLANRHELTERVRCPVHGFIRYSRAERDIINHWAFQRLRNIRQLALCYYVYPGAMHTRFEHSLGVMEMATRAFESVRIKNRDLLERELQEIPELRTDTLNRALLVLRLFALLHDTGHAPFSHVGEKSIPGEKHEPVSSFVVEALADKIDGLFFEGAGGLVTRLTKQAPELAFLRQFVIGEMDMDRTDYLRRDSLHCGVEYGKFDFRRLIETLTVIKHPHSGRLQLAIEKGGEHTFEALILARYQMNTQVYFHRIRRIYDYYVSEYMKSWAAEKWKSFDDVLRFDDYMLWAEMKKDSEDSNPRSAFATRILKRNHHRCVFETGDTADFWELQKSRLLLAHLKDAFKGTEFILDRGEGSIHKLTVRGQHEEEKVEDLFVVERNGGCPRPITELSAILEKIPKKFRVVRIYADAEYSKLVQMRESAQEMWRRL